MICCFNTKCEDPQYSLNLCVGSDFCIHYNPGRIKPSVFSHSDAMACGAMMHEISCKSMISSIEKAFSFAPGCTGSI